MIKRKTVETCLKEWAQQKTIVISSTWAYNFFMHSSSDYYICEGLSYDYTYANKVAEFIAVKRLKLESKI